MCPSLCRTLHDRSAALTHSQTVWFFVNPPFGPVNNMCCIDSVSITVISSLKKFLSFSLATRLTQWPLRNMGMDHVRSLRGGGLLYRSCKEKFTGYSESSDQKYEVKHCV